MNIKLFDKLGAWDDGRLALKPISARIPVHVMARLQTICELFPSKTRTVIITELLKAGLEKFEESLPPTQFDDEEIHEGQWTKIPRPGPRLDYYRGANYNNHKLEAELKNKNAGPLFPEIE